MEQAAAEQALFRRNTRNVSFLRRLSQRMSIFGFNKSGRNLLDQPIDESPTDLAQAIEIVDSEPRYQVNF